MLPIDTPESIRKLKVNFNESSCSGFLEAKIEVNYNI